MVRCEDGRGRVAESRGQIGLIWWMGQDNSGRFRGTGAVGDDTKGGGQGLMATQRERNRALPS